MITKYCIFSAQYLPHLGGIERYTYNISKELLKMGNQVTIVTNNTTKSSTVEENEGIKIYRFSCFAPINGRFPIPKVNKTFKEISNYLRQQDFDVIIINARFYIHSLYAARFAKKRGIPCLCIDHGTSHLSVHNKILDSIGGVYEHVHTWILKQYCKNYYGVSRACCYWLKHFHISAKGVLYNAVDLEKIEELKKSNLYDFRKTFKIKDDIAVAFTGRLLKEKGIYEMIEAVERFNHNNIRKIHLLIAGDGDEWEYVNKHASDNIHPLGRLRFDEIVMLDAVRTVRDFLPSIIFRRFFYICVGSCCMQLFYYLNKTWWDERIGKKPRVRNNIGR